MANTSGEPDFDTPVDRASSDSSKWRKYRGQDVIPLWVADMDFRSPQPVIDALVDRARHGVFGYTSPQPELLEAVVSFYRGLFQYEIDPDWVLWLPSLGVGLNLVCQALADPGEEIVTTTPIYPPFLSAAARDGRRGITVPLICDGKRWVMDLDAVEAAITPRTKLFLLCNPHNPVGRLYSSEELGALAGLCTRHGLVLCSDEVHCGLVLDAELRHTPTASLSPEIAQRTITLMSPSKTYNLPGLKCAFALVPNPELRRRLREAQLGLTGGGNIFGYTSATVALSRCEPWRQALLAYLRGNRDMVETAVANIGGLSMTHVEATYLAWIDTRSLDLARPKAFFEEAGVGLEDGLDFGLEGFVRLNFGCPRDTLAKGLCRIERAVAEC